MISANLKEWLVQNGTFIMSKITLGFREYCGILPLLSVYEKNVYCLYICILLWLVVSVCFSRFP